MRSWQYFAEKFGNNVEKKTLFNSFESLLNPFFAYSEYPKIQFRVPNPSLSKKLFRFLKHNTVGYRFEISAIKIVCMSVVTWFWISNFEADIKNSRIVLFSDFSLLWHGLECTVKNVLYFRVNSVTILRRYQQRRTLENEGLIEFYRFSNLIFFSVEGIEAMNILEHSASKSENLFAKN